MTTMQTTALKEQHTRYADIRRRLMGGVPEKKSRPQQVTEIAIVQPEADAPEAPEAAVLTEPNEAALIDETVPRPAVASNYEELLKENAALRAALIVAEADISMLDVPRRPAKDIIADVLPLFKGIRWVDIRSNRRLAPIVAAKHACVWEVYVQRPDLSTCQIGRIFGIDHSTVNYIVRSKEAYLGNEEAAAVLKRKLDRSKEHYNTHYRKSAAQ